MVGRHSLVAALVVAVVGCATEPTRGAPSCVLTTPTPAPVYALGSTATIATHASCENLALLGLRWASSAPGVVAIDSLTGQLRAASVGSAIVTVSVIGVPSATLQIPVSVTTSGATDGSVPVVALSVSPSYLTLSPLDTSRLRAQLALPAGSAASRDAAFSSTDSCVARVRGDGFVQAGHAGTAVVRVASVAYPTLVQDVGVAVTVPGALRLTLQSLTTGTSQTPVDPSAVRGTVTATANVGASLLPDGGRVELSIAGRVAASTTVPAPTSDLVAVPLTVNTAARDSLTGAPLFANGAQSLVVSVFGARRDLLPGCVARPGPVASITQVVTLANQ